MIDLKKSLREQRKNNMKIVYRIFVLTLVVALTVISCEFKVKNQRLQNRIKRYEDQMTPLQKMENGLFVPEDAREKYILWLWSH